MANYTINNLTELTGVVSTDLVPVWDVSASATRKATVANVLAGLMAAANAFTANQTISPVATSDDGLTVVMPSATTRYAIVVRDSALSSHFLLSVDTNDATLYINGGDFGNNVVGPSVRLTRNTNGTKPGAAFVNLMNRAGTAYRIWPDASGNLRIHTADPIYDNDGLGTVIGTQTSSLDSKIILGEVGDPLEALQAVLEAAQKLMRFQYKSGAFNGEEFEGVVTDFSPRYGMDRDEEHPAGKSLNVIQILGDLIRSVALIAERVGLADEVRGQA
ncbi:MAG TPA: hypothetical protein PKD12_15690 [Nitrospira sp.]|nr:hypothetical protein [Nitrospira sp.]